MDVEPPFRHPDTDTQHGETLEAEIFVELITSRRRKVLNNLAYESFLLNFRSI